MDILENIALSNHHHIILNICWNIQCPGFILWCFWKFLSFQRPENGYKNNIVIAFNQTMEAMALNYTYREIEQLCLQVHDLVYKSYTITYEHEELGNIAEQVKNNISSRKIELTTINRISKLKCSRQERWARWKNQKHQDGVSKANLCGLERSYD